MSIESVLSKTSDVCVRAEGAINPSLSNENGLSVTKLSEQIAETVGLKQPMVYHIITMLIHERPDIYVKMGKGGGITKVPADHVKSEDGGLKDCGKAECKLHVRKKKNKDES